MPTGPLFIYPYIIRRGCSGAAGGSPWTRLILPEKKINISRLTLFCAGRALPDRPAEYGALGPPRIVMEMGRRRR